MISDKKTEQGVLMKYIISFAAVAAAILILTRPVAVSGAVFGAVMSCLEVVIPSLFAFTVLSVYLQNSGLYRLVLRPLTYPLSKLLRLDEELCAVFVLGNIGGYPVGAKLITQLVQQERISREESGRLLCFCYGSGPSFVIAIAGVRVLGSAAAGGVMFTSCFMASLIIGLVVCRSGNIRLLPSESKYDLGSGCFVEAVLSAARVMFTVCAMITVFSVVIAAVDVTGISSALEQLLARVGAGLSSGGILPALLEISHMQELIYDKPYVAPLCGALLSFGGVCVLLQISALTHGEIPLRQFLISRVPSAILSAVFSCAAIPFCTADAVIVPTSGWLQGKLFSVNAGMSLCVVMMCIILLCSLGKQQRSNI